MKKITVLFMTVVLLGLFLISGCEKKSPTSITNQDVYPYKYDYYFCLSYVNYNKDNEEHTYDLCIYSEQTQITSCNVIMNGETLDLENYDFCFGIEDLALTENMKYEFTVKINNSKYEHNFTLKTPSHLTINWPNSISPTSDTTIEWNLPHDSMLQEILFIAGDDYGNYEYLNKVLKPSDRKFTLKKGTFPNYLNYISTELKEVNYYCDSNKILAVALTRIDYIDFDKSFKSRFEEIKKFMNNFNK